MAVETIHVRGLKELNRALVKADKDTKKLLRAEFRRVGDIVRDEARSRFSTVDARSAAGFRTAVRQRGVTVEQSIRRTTGSHPEFGVRQMQTALIPALDEKENDVVRGMEHVLDVVAVTNGF